LAKRKATTCTEDYIRGYRFQSLGADIDDGSRERIGSAIADIFASGGSLRDAAKAVERAVDGMTESRAQIVAGTVLNDAYNGVMLDSAKEVGSGFSLKTWRPDGKCCTGICQRNVDAGPIPLDAPFPSGRRQGILAAIVRLDL